ncbi:MAG: helix-turn-helix domain-containing protein [Candidatus Odinarchaeia archaeon]
MTNNSDETYLGVGDASAGIVQTRPKGDLKEYVYNLLKERGALTRSQMVELTGIPRTTLYDTLDKLILQGKVEKYKLKEKKKGRPTVLYEACI